MVNITNFSFINTTSDISSVCELNQFKLLEATAKLPKLAFYLALAIFIALFIHYIVVPFFHKKSYYDYIKDAFPGFAFAMSIYLVLILFLFTFQLTADQISRVSKILLWIFIPLASAKLLWIFYPRKQKKHGDL